jgi:broad specificity phosphatase PhoE
VREYRPEGGESWLDVNKRAREFTEELVTKYMPKAEE